MIARWPRSIATRAADPRLRITALVLYYLAIQVAAFLLAASGSFSAPSFIYQGF